MKQIKVLILASFIALFTGCGGGGGGASTDTTVATVTTETSQTIAIDKIKAYANDQTQPVPTVNDYADAGVIGVTVENISDINAVVASLTAEDVDTKEEIQALADDLGIILPADTTKPVITVLGDNPAKVTQNTMYTDAGATATDDRDGTVLVNTEGSVNTLIVGTYTITYTATDSANNTATATRTVNVVPPGDTTAPIITINGDNPATVIQNTTYNDTGATATDDRDGTVLVNTEGSVNTLIVGTYTITYTATDSANNTATATRTVNVESLVYLKKTAQTVSHTMYDDGYYQKGMELVYTRDNILEIVTEEIEGLMWQDNEESKTVLKPWITQGKYDAGQYFDTSGDTAINYCSALTLGGYNDWRLPTRAELRNLINYGHRFPAINFAFKNWVYTGYWSSSTSIEFPNFGDRNAGTVQYGYGHFNTSSKDTYLNIRCVRDIN